MTEVLKNDPEMLRSCILFEFIDGFPIFTTFKKLCRKLGDDFMDYLEFEFWFMRFSQGKYDLDYDRSLDPKTRSFTDLPVEIFEKIGDSLHLNDRFALRKVSRDIQARVDSWTPRVTDIQLFEYWSIKESRTLPQRVECSEKTIEDVMSLFKNPKLRLDTLMIFLNDKSKKIFRILERNCVNHKIHVKKFDDRYGFSITPSALKVLNIGTLEEVSVSINRESVEFNEFLNSDHLKGLKMLNIETRLCPSVFPLGTFQNHPRVAIKFEGGYAERKIPDFIKNLMRSTQLQICHLSSLSNKERIMREFQSPETMVPGFPDLRHFPIPGSNEFYEIEFGSNGRIRIERMH